MTSAHRWQEGAACRFEQPERFTQPEPADIAPAKDTCRRCPVRQQCLATALRHDPIADVGIWGGTTPDERDQLRRTHQADTTATRRVDPPDSRAGRVRRYPQPQVTVARDRHGDYTDVTGRIIIVRLPAHDWMLLVDGRPHRRTRTLADAQQAAWQALHHPGRTTAPSARARAATPQRTAAMPR